MEVKWIEQRDPYNSDYINDICKIDGEDMFEISAGAFAYCAKYINPKYSDLDIALRYENLDVRVKERFGEKSIANERAVIREFFFADYKNRVLPLIEKEQENNNGLVWVNALCYTNDCASVLKKDGESIFKIMRGRDLFYTEYCIHNLVDLFAQNTLSYSAAAKMAKEKYGEDSIENRLLIAKETFLKDIRRDIEETKRKLEELEVVFETNL